MSRCNFSPPLPSQVVSCFLCTDAPSALLAELDGDEIREVVGLYQGDAFDEAEFMSCKYHTPTFLQEPEEKSVSDVPL